MSNSLIWHTVRTLSGGWKKAIERFKSIYIIIIYSLSFSYHYYLMGFHWSLSDRKSPQFSRTFLSILANLTNAVVWMVAFRPVISKSSSPFINPLVTVSKAPIISCINVTFMFHSFFNSRARSRYLSFFSLSFNFTMWSARRTKSTILQVLFFDDYYTGPLASWLECSPLIQETGVQSRSRLKDMVHDAALPNTQYYEVRIKCNVEQCRECSSYLPYTSVWWLLKRSLLVTLDKGR